MWPIWAYAVTFIFTAKESLDIVTAYDFLGGRIVAERNYWDNAALQGQMG